MEKKYFETRKEALKVCEQRNSRCNANQVYRIKHGRNKGKFFVGDYMQYINLY